MGPFISILGICILLAIAYLFSENKKKINPRTIIGAFAIQICIGAFILYVPFGQTLLLQLSKAVANVISYANAGIDFLFAGLVSDKMGEVFGDGGFIFAFRVLPVIIFFSALISTLYYLGIMQFIVKLIGGFIQKALGTSRAESLSATANIFVGQSEAPLVIRPFLNQMTRSELFAIMVGGLASVAGSVLAGYAGLGVELKYLIAASFMAAPGGLLMAKIIIPETEKPIDIKGDLAETEDEKPINVIHAAANGASNGLHLALNVGAMLLAFIGLIALLNGIVGGIGNLFNYEDLTIQYLLGILFAPIAWVLGVPWEDANLVGSLIGQKLILNEFVAYIDLAKMTPDLAPISQAIATFALCGFANLSSLAILLGGIGLMAPRRRPEIAQLGLKAVLAGSLSNLMSAAIAGLFIGMTI